MKCKRARDSMKEHTIHNSDTRNWANAITPIAPTSLQEATSLEIAGSNQSAGSNQGGRVIIGCVPSSNPRS